MSNIARTVDELTELAWSEQQRANRAEAEVQRLHEAMRTMNVVPAADHRGAVEDRDELRAMLGRLLDVALVDGYGETVRDEAETLLSRLSGGRTS